MRRITDLVASAVGILVLAPLFLLIAVIIRFGSRGPALFHQERAGRFGRPFFIHKFRTMRVTPTGTGPEITGHDDARITRVGRLLRRLKLDELPQLFNVLKGEMALVGPRPEVPGYVALYPEAARRNVLSVRPGITDLASLYYIDESRLLADAADLERFYVENLLPRKLELAAAYVAHRSWWLDLRILVATFTGILGWHWMPAPWNELAAQRTLAARGPEPPDDN